MWVVIMSDGPSSGWSNINQYRMEEEARDSERKEVPRREMKADGGI